MIDSIRKAFICRGCEAVYSDSPVSSCDCLIGGGFDEHYIVDADTVRNARRYLVLRNIGVILPDGKWRLVPSEYMESLTLPNPPAELAISAKPVAMVDAGDDGYFAEILPDCSVSVGDQLYAFPPLNVDRELWIESFNQWWEAHGQYLRAGGGQYEKTFGYHAWEAAAALYIEPPPPQQSPWQPIATAPMDGQEVLLIVESRAGCPDGMLVGHYMRGGHCIEDHPPIAAGWYFWNGHMFDVAAKPTHWMPLTEPAP